MELCNTETKMVETFKLLHYLNDVSFDKFYGKEHYRNWLSKPMDKTFKGTH